MDEAYRITLEYEDDRYTVKSVRKLAMRVPVGDKPSDKAREESGRFVELRGAKGEALYRRRIGHILPRRVEFPTGDPAKPFGHGRPPRGPRTVSLLVPARAEGYSVALVETGPRGKARRRGERKAARAAGPRDLISIDLPRNGGKADGRR